MKRTLFFMLLSALLLGRTVTVQAETYSGNCGADGANVTWKLDTETGVLEISGTGAMKDYLNAIGNDAPWRSLKDLFTSVTIGEGVTTIGDYAFYNCLGLTSVTIPNNITSIGDRAFSRCTGVKNLRIEDGTETLVLSTSSSSTPFDNCPLDTVYLGRNVSYSNSYSPFKGKTNLVSLTIGSKVTAIGNEAFSGCSGLASVTVYAENPPQMMDNSFAGAGTELWSEGSELPFFVPVESVNKYKADESWKNLNIKIKCQIGGIGYNILSSEARTAEVVSGVYSGDIVIPATMEYEGITYRVIAISDYAFWWLSGLTSVTIGDGVTTIGSSAFYNCSGLTSVTIGESVTAIGGDAFYGCGNLERFEGKWASTDHRCLVVNDTLCFFAPNGLTEYTIPDGVTVIGARAFSGCSGLTALTIPESVSIAAIGDGAFDKCWGLKSITVYNPTPKDISISSDVFGVVNSSKCKLYVPENAVSAYKAAAGWNMFKRIVPIEVSAPNRLWYGGTGIWDTYAAGWLTSPEAADLNRFAEGDIAVFGDASEQGDGQTGVVELRENLFVSGIHADNDATTYRITVPEDTKYVLTGVGGAQLVKEGEGAFYTDIDLEDMTTVLKSGTLGRYQKESAESAVFGSKILVPEGAKATLVLSKEKSTNVKYYPALNVDSLVVGAGAELDFYLPAYGKMRADTTVYIAGNGTINFYTDGNRFFAGGNAGCRAGTIFFNEESGQWSNKDGDWSSKQLTSKWVDYGTDFSGFDGTVTIQNDMAENDSTVGLFILGLHKGANEGPQFLAKTEGDSTLYNVWKAAQSGDAGKDSVLERICYNWKNIDLVIDNLGCLACPSVVSGISNNTTILRTRSLNVKEKGHVAGFYKDSDPTLIIMTGSNDEDARIDGTFTAATKGGSYKEGYQVYTCGAGLIKEGHGTYYITAIDNVFSNGIDVYEGGVMFNNSDPENTSATGQHKNSTDPVVICREYGHIGGTGTIGGTTELYGTLYPGDESVSAFRIDGSHAGRTSYRKSIGGIPKNLANGNEFWKVKYTQKEEIAPDYFIEVADTMSYGKLRVSGSNASLFLHDGAKIAFDANGKAHHDTVLVQRDIRLMEGTEAKVKIGLSPRGAFNVAEGDTLVLLKSYRAYYGENSKAIVGPESFEIELSDQFAGAQFKLDTTWVASVMQTVMGADGTPEQKEVVPSEWKLIAVATASGSGESKAVYDFTPTAVTPADSVGVPALKNITLAFDETPSLVGKTATLTKGGDSWTATLAEGKGSTLVITLADTLKALGEYTLTIPEGTFGDKSFGADQKTGHCNPALTYTCTVKAPVVKDLEPKTIDPVDGAEVPALKNITLIFDETPSLVGKTATLTKGGDSWTATLAAGEGGTLVVTLADTLKVNGTYTLTIPEGTFGDADFVANPAIGHCNHALVYTFTIKVPEPAEPDVPDTPDVPENPDDPENPDTPDTPDVPDEPENPDEPDEPVVPDEPASVTETQQDAEHIAVYNPQGVLILETNDAADLRKLSAGFYIVNGKKMIITR